MKAKAILCDIDMTLLDTSEIEKEASIFEPPYRYEYFRSQLHRSKKLDWCYRLLHNCSDFLIFLTARGEECREQTTPFLDRLNKPYKLIMRKEEHKHLTDCEYKKECISGILKAYDIIVAIDDKYDNCSLFYSYGIPTLQVFYPSQSKGEIKND